MITGQGIDPAPELFGGGLFSRSGESLGHDDAWGVFVCGTINPCRVKSQGGSDCCIRISSHTRSRTRKELDQEWTWSQSRICHEQTEYKTDGSCHPHHQWPGLPWVSSSGGSDLGDLAKRSTHPKPRNNSSVLGFEVTVMSDESHDAGGLQRQKGGHMGESSEIGGSHTKYKPQMGEEMDKPRQWAMEVYKGKQLEENLEGGG
jgi:hypothetical protein